MERRLVGFEARMESQLERPESRLLGRIEEMVGSVQSKQQKWTIGLWTTTVLAVVATRLFLAQGLDLSRPNPTAEFPPPFA
ncbi:MAG: hypothetical protein HY337_11660 [Gemmatimonadetes bacterium]|nr:hypothetical protein [Gemmatimonadota bacterium]